MGLIEHIYYESLPFVYGAAGIYALMHFEESHLAAVAGVILLFCSYQVFYERYKYRDSQRRRREKEKSFFEAS